SAFSGELSPALAILLYVLVQLRATLASLSAAITSHLALRFVALCFCVNSTILVIDSATRGRPTAIAVATGVTVRSAAPTMIAAVRGAPASVLSQLPPPMAGTPAPAILPQVGSAGRDIACYLPRPERAFWPKLLPCH